MCDHMNPATMTTILPHVFCRELNSDLYVSHPIIMRNMSATLYRSTIGVLHVYRSRGVSQPDRPVIELEVYDSMHFTLGLE